MTFLLSLLFDVCYFLKTIPGIFRGGIARKTPGILNEFSTESRHIM